jgi:uncharacterized protein
MISARLPSILVILSALLGSCVTVNAPEPQTVSMPSFGTVNIQSPDEVRAPDFDRGLEAYFRGDYVAALREWRPLAEQGHLRAQNNLGVTYAKGQGVPQDYAEAMRWYILAANQGDASAQNNLGVMYAEGLGVRQNNVLAHKWYSLSAAQGEEEAARNRDIVESEMTPAEIAEAQRLAREAWDIQGGN